MTEDWDKDIEINVGLTEGHHKYTIIGIQPFKSLTGKQGVKLFLGDKKILNSTAQNMIEALRDAKPVLDKTIEYNQKGTQLQRRFDSIVIK